MRESASNLGRKFNMTGEEMNRLLFNEGYLSGEPGDYSPTEKASKYVEEKIKSRGNGGYSQYNPTWIIRTYDTSILEDININQEKINKAKNDVSAKRNLQKAEGLASVVEKIDVPNMFDQPNVVECKKNIMSPKMKTVGAIAIPITITITAVGVGVYIYFSKKRKTKKKAS